VTFFYKSALEILFLIYFRYS